MAVRDALNATVKVKHIFAIVMGPVVYSRETLFAQCAAGLFALAVIAYANWPVNGPKRRLKTVASIQELVPTGIDFERMCGGRLPAGVESIDQNIDRAIAACQEHEGTVGWYWRVLYDLKERVGRGSAVAAAQRLHERYGTLSGMTSKDVLSGRWRDEFCAIREFEAEAS